MSLRDRLKALDETPMPWCEPCQSYHAAGVQGCYASDSPMIQMMGARNTPFGLAFYLRIYTPSKRQLSWTEVCKCFNESYPDWYAAQFFPPAAKVVDEANIYHLFAFNDPFPKQFNIDRR